MSTDETEEDSRRHGARMDATYRWMKYIYDPTRVVVLRQRGALRRRIIALQPRRVLEIGHGTGRNLIKLAVALPEAELVGADISGEMRAYAAARIKQAGVDQRIRLIAADGVPATAALAGSTDVDCVFFSYSLSMIPRWQDALRDANRLIGGSRGRLLIADFDDFAGWPPPLRRQILRLLQSFHVFPRTDIVAFVTDDPIFAGWTLMTRRSYRGWAVLYELAPPCP